MGVGAAGMAGKVKPTGSSTWTKSSKMPSTESAPRQAAAAASNGSPTRSRQRASRREAATARPAKGGRPGSLRRAPGPHGGASQ
eukprot:590804-Alexandrium_andersonii.AAC.1